MTIYDMKYIVQILLIIVFTIITAQHSIRLTLTLLREADCTLNNYRGNEVVFGMGIAFIPVLIITTALLFLLNSRIYNMYLVYLFAVCSIGFAALLDDLIGNKKIKGLKGHILSFFHGQLTTGFVKAFIGGAVSIAISLAISADALDLFLNVFSIALFTNALNLMDLRPGRCIKVFLAVAFGIIITNIENIPALMPLVVLLTASLIYMKYDLQEICMLGDTGSNILGITLGYFSAISFATTGKIISLAVLIAINLTAEKISISKLIANNRFLSFLDNLGRSS